MASLVFLANAASAQYILNGSAQQISCNCYTITEEKSDQRGSVWNSNKINLTSSFDFWFNVFLGCKDSSGADGIVFILQANSTSVGNTGGGMGFSGVKPSIGIALDTWENSMWADPSYDHISIQANGDVDHRSDLAGPVPASAVSDNIEDCNWHVLRVAWNADSKTLTAFFDGVLRLQKQIDLVDTIFNGDPEVFWGFSSSTGGFSNRQGFCTALNPIIKTSLQGSDACEGSAVDFSEASESFAPIESYTWNFGDGTTSTEKVPPPHTYTKAGSYPVTLKIRGKDGCEEDSTITLKVASVPTGTLSVYDTCFGLVPRYQFADSNISVSYQWLLDDQPFSTARQPRLTMQSEGPHKLQVVVTSNAGCNPPAVLESRFTINPLPAVRANVTDGCAGEPLSFQGFQTDNRTTVGQWHWRYGDGGTGSSQNTVHRYKAGGQYEVDLSAVSTKGCVSATAKALVSIDMAFADAGHDTAVIIGYPFQLQGAGNGALLWSPAQGLSSATEAKPTVTLTDDQQFVLTATTTKGCVAKDSVLVKTFKGPAIYVPTAFTPNGDGKNETLKPTYVGVKELKQFAVYNRWGQAMFTTKETNRGWDGRTAPSGTYVWLVQAIDSGNRPITIKGTVTIIR